MEPQKLLSSIPAVNDIIHYLAANYPKTPDSLLSLVAREAAQKIREEVLAGERLSLKREDVFELASAILERKLQPSLRRVVNATGVVIHTNLGRSPLAREVMEAISEISVYYSNLEYDLASGKRGSRYVHVEEIVRELTGAEGALVVNNNASAVLITLNTLALGKEVIVSRGELVEIGGSFRIPDVMARSGAILREVGATNRTHLRDYEAAINENTALLLKVHKSNYAMLGFTKEVSGKELVSLGQKYGLPVAEDLGSGCFVDLSQYGLPKEPTVQEVLLAGLDIVTFSGDKLLGGPQAGIIVGKKELVAEIRKNPLNRAVRIDKMTIAGLEATLRLYRDKKEALEKIPTLHFLTIPPEEIKKKARRLKRALLRVCPEGVEIKIVKTISRVGGGAMPLSNPASYAIAFNIPKVSASRLEKKFRDNTPPIIGRIEDEMFLLDMRTVFPEEIPIIVEAFQRVLGEVYG